MAQAISSTVSEVSFVDGIVISAEQAADQGGVALMEVSATDPVTLDKEDVSRLELNDGDVQTVQELHGVNLRSPEFGETPGGATESIRKAAINAAVRVSLSFGMGPKSSGYGPYVRSVVNAMIHSHLGLKSTLRIPTKDLNMGNLIMVLAIPEFNTNAIPILDGIVAKLAQKNLAKPVSLATLRSRTRNAARARLWIESDMRTTYMMSLDILKSVGYRQECPGIGALNVDRLVGMALGRDITIGEVYKSIK